MTRTLMLYLALLCWASAVRAEDNSIETIGPPVDGLPGAVAEVLVPEGLGVSLEGEPVWELWMLRELSSTEGVEPALGQELAALPEGGLVGVVRLVRDWHDYKGTRVGAGLYTLRYLVAPVDGAHLGTSLYRDFLLLVPVAADGGPGEAYGFEDLVTLSREATGTNHPAVVALFPDWSVDGGEAEAPYLGANELDQPTVLVAVGGVRFGLVVAGRGES